MQSPNNNNNNNLKLVCSSTYFPKKNKKRPLGEDAHFICADAETIGVADGVGGWASLGIDAGEYARELMNNASNSVSLNHRDRKAPVDPATVLREAYGSTAAKGSSTACILCHSGGILRSANVGDSGFLIFRGNKMFYQSEIQQKPFNCPYQLGNGRYGSRPDCAAVLSLAVAEGDVIVLGTDGFLDNMFPREVEAILARQSLRYGGLDSARLACSIAQTALLNSYISFGDIPFSLAAKRAGFTHKGGKIDDITVVVGIVTSDS